MTESSVSSAPEIVGPLRDEAALERQFRARFSALCAEAKGHLGEEAASAAPKVVEATFRHAWDDREQIASDADLEAYLHDMVRRASARELSRRAGARHLSHGATTGAHHTATAVTDVESAWQHLTRQLHPEATRAEAAAYAEQLRHHAAEHVGDAVLAAGRDRAHAASQDRDRQDHDERPGKHRKGKLRRRPVACGT